MVLFTKGTMGLVLVVFGNKESSWSGPPEWEARSRASSQCEKRMVGFHSRCFLIPSTIAWFFLLYSQCSDKDVLVVLLAVTKECLRVF